MKTALAQIDVRAGDPEYNFNTMRKYILQAKAQGVDVVVFSEMVVGGYFVGDLYTNDEFCQNLMSYNDRIKELSDGIVIIYGNIYLEEREYISIEVIGGSKKIHTRGFDGRKIRYNAAYACQDKKILRRDTSSYIIPEGIQPKNLLPNYRYFDDKRYFYSPKDWGCKEVDSEAISPFIANIKGKRVKLGVCLCEDLWLEDYRSNPAFGLAYSDIIFNLSASPWTFGKNSARDRRVKSLFDWEEKKYTNIKHLEKDGEYKLKSYEKIAGEYVNTIMVESPVYPPYAYVNCCGSQNTGKNILCFDGATTVYGRDGEPKILANSNYKEELLIFDSENIPKETISRGKEENIHRKYQAIVRGIKHISEVTGIRKYICGSSGGIDSSVVLCLLGEAIGVDNIITINMPSQYNSDKTKNASQYLCKELKIKDYRIIPINEIVNTKIETIYKQSPKPPSSLAQENIQAETRGMILSAIAGEEKALFTCNANKIENTIGYFSINGDGRGAICPIADLTKVEVYDMARYINKEIFKKEVIPESLLPDNNYQFTTEDKIKPSAELKNEQIDPIKISYHCSLIEKIMDYKKVGPNQICQWWLDKELHIKLGISEELMRIYKIDDAQEFINDLKWFCGRIKASVFKRVQSPPIIIVSKTSFGYDLRESILPITESGVSEDMENKVIEKRKY